MFQLSVSTSPPTSDPTVLLLSQDSTITIMCSKENDVPRFTADANRLRIASTKGGNYLYLSVCWGFKPCILVACAPFAISYLGYLLSRAEQILLTLPHPQEMAVVAYLVSKLRTVSELMLLESTILVSSRSVEFLVALV